jgi:3-methyladenine DNA glycosylase AlkD
MSLQDRVQSALAWLEKKGTQRDRDNLKRFGITADKFFGVSMANLRVLAKQLGRDHELADALWKTGWYEARLLACLIDEPVKVTPAQMDRWCRDFDSWAVCDTACFHLFDRTPHAFKKIAQWSQRRAEFEKRAAFALLASVALHDKKAEDEPFVESLLLVERAATDERNFVKKSLVWALRGVGGRNPGLYSLVISVAERLADSTDTTARWVGKTTLRELRSAASMKRLAKQKK